MYLPVEWSLEMRNLDLKASTFSILHQDTQTDKDYSWIIYRMVDKLCIGFTRGEMSLQMLLVVFNSSSSLPFSAVSPDLLNSRCMGPNGVSTPTDPSMAYPVPLPLRMSHRAPPKSLGRKVIGTCKVPEP